MGFVFEMKMGMKSLKWEGFGTKNVFPQICTPDGSATDFLLDVRESSNS